MKKRIFSVGIVIGLVLCLVYNLSAQTITLLHSNDIHGTFKPYKFKVDDKKRLVGGMEAVSHYLNKIRAEEKNVLLIDLGDIMTGTPATDVEYEGVIGGTMMEFLNRLEYDVWSCGNHAFDRGQQNALGIIKLARFPTVMANIIYKESGRLFSGQPYQIFDKAGLKVGVIAVMEENFLEEVRRESVVGLDVLPIVPTLKAYVPVLDRQTDLIVVLSHGRFEQGIRIAENVPGVDVVLVAAEDGQFQEVNGVLLKSTFGHQKTLGYLKVEVEEDKIVNYEEKLVWLWADVELKPSPQVTSLVEKVDALISLDYAKVVGEAKSDLSIELYPRYGEIEESTLGNWITDVMRWKTGAQIGLQNSGGIRANISAGPITKADIFKVSPFHNTLVVFKLRGQQVKDALEHDLERDQDRMQVSGIKYKYYSRQARPFGERIDYVEINGEVLVKDGRILHPEKIYTVVSNDYMVGHAEDKYFGFPAADPYYTGLILDQTLIEWLVKHKVLDYRPEKRIVNIAK
jgi:5'-nucleotidase/UDP-sugar diphosphatase